MPKVARQEMIHWRQIETLPDPRAGGLALTLLSDGDGDTCEKLMPAPQETHFEMSGLFPCPVHSTVSAASNTLPGFHVGPENKDRRAVCRGHLARN